MGSTANAWGDRNDGAKAKSPRLSESTCCGTRRWRSQGTISQHLLRNPFYYDMADEEFAEPESNLSLNRGLSRAVPLIENYKISISCFFSKIYKTDLEDLSARVFSDISKCSI